jgi:hypothetical protein
MRVRSLVLLAPVAVWPAIASATPTVVTTVVRAPLVGQLSTPSPGHANIGFYGTDLGLTTVAPDASGHKQIRIVFGDTWASSQGGTDPAGGVLLGSDDTQGVICLAAPCPNGVAALPTGDAVDAFVNAGTAAAGRPSWARPGPPIVMQTNTSGLVDPIQVYRGSASGTLLNMGPLRTPVAVFDNGLSGAGAAAFGLFIRSDYLKASIGPPAACATGFIPDPDLGIAAASLFVPTEAWLPCVNGNGGGTDPTCVAFNPGLGIDGYGGICVDPTSAPYLAQSHLLAATNVLQVGNADPLVPNRYYTQDWPTTKFMNPVTRTVNNFASGRANGSTLDDFTAPDGTTTGNEKVFVWGRPAFIGPGGIAELYFAYVDMPSYSAAGTFPWAPHYFTGIVNNVPQFSTSQDAAVPLLLESSAAASGSPTETVDITEQMTVSWVPALHSWVMLYGGDNWPFYAGAASRRNPGGAILARFAAEPWGPWSPTQVVFTAGDPAHGTGQYGSGGILYTGAAGACTSNCAPPEPAQASAPGAPNPYYGFLYGASIIEPWTMTRTSPAGADVYWTVSTFAPYAVVLMRTTIKP